MEESKLIREFEDINEVVIDTVTMFEEIEEALADEDTIKEFGNLTVEEADRLRALAGVIVTSLIDLETVIVKFREYFKRLIEVGEVNNHEPVEEKVS
jgi:hypothetical protein